MTKPTQLMPELLILREMLDDEEIVILRSEVERLIADNDRLKAENEIYSRSPSYDEMAKKIALLREALEKIANNIWNEPPVIEIARAALTRTE